MTGTVKKLKANRVLDGKECGWCKKSVVFGEDAAMCESCMAGHHALCWDGKGGCATSGCVGAPLKQLAPARRPREAMAPGRTLCPHCRLQIDEGSMLCPFCGKGLVSPDGIYRGPQTTAPGAVASLVLGILGIFVCGLIFGIMAIQKANEAKELIENDPSLSGGGIATAGKVMGILSLVVWGLGLILQLGGGL
jgi:hypothetical protein